MRRILLTLALLSLTYGLTAPGTRAAEPSARQICEAYCIASVLGCYLGPGVLIGRDKCDAQYQGCMHGCLAALQAK